MPRAYSEEFRERAVAMILEDGSPLRDVAKSLGVSVTGLDRRVRQARINQGFQQHLNCLPVKSLPRMFCRANK